MLWLYEHAYGIRIPDPYSGSCRVAVERLSGAFSRVEDPAPGDLLYFERRPLQGNQRHVGIVESSVWMAHALQDAGVERRRLYLSLRENPLIYRHNSRME